MPVVAEQMGVAFPELRQNPDKVAGILRDEEADFSRRFSAG